MINYDCNLENELTIALKLNNTIYYNLYFDYLLANNRFDILIKYKNLMYKIDYNLIPEIYRTYEFTIDWIKNTNKPFKYVQVKDFHYFTILNEQYIIKNNEFIEKNIFNGNNITEIKYYENKKIKSISNFYNKKIFYHIIIIYQKKFNYKHSIQLNYDKNEKLIEQQNYLNGMKHGIFIEYNSNGQSKIYNYKYNKLDGEYLTFFENGICK